MLPGNALRELRWDPLGLFFGEGEGEERQGAGLGTGHGCPLPVGAVSLGTAQQRPPVRGLSGRTGQLPAASALPTVPATPIHHVQRYVNLRALPFFFFGGEDINLGSV